MAGLTVRKVNVVWFTQNAGTSIVYENVVKLYVINASGSPATFGINGFMQTLAPGNVTAPVETANADLMDITIDCTDQVTVGYFKPLPQYLP